MKKGGGLPGLSINTGTYSIMTTLTKSEIDEMIEELNGIEDMDTNSAYARLYEISNELLNKKDALTIDSNRAEVSTMRIAAEKHHDRPVRIANILINILEHLQMKGGRRLRVRRQTKKNRKHRVRK